LRITLEADYAVRIIDYLACYEKRQDARSISEQINVTLRFTLKILRKLVQAKLVRSFKGVTGGYELIRDPSEINMKEVIEAVDGPILINRCLVEDASCSRTDDKKICYYHNAYAEVSEIVRDKLEKITFDKSKSFAKNNLTEK
jgi:Rrf2 family iron-sulfur cluster assembly transcriptional regulator